MSNHIFVVRPYEGEFGVWEKDTDYNERPLVTYETASEARAAADRALKKYEMEDWRDESN